MQQHSFNDSLELTSDRLVKFCTYYSPDYQRQICANPKECVMGDYLTLAQLRRNFGENAAKVWLIPQLADLATYCGSKEKLNEKQYEGLAFIIESDFYYLKISEIMLFFHRFKSGRYGRFYGSVDPMLITCSLRDFIKERNILIDNYEQEVRELKEREQAKKAISWEEYCKNHNLQNTALPL